MEGHITCIYGDHFQDQANLIQAVHWILNELAQGILHV